jgi:hypothetical protein
VSGETYDYARDSYQYQQHHARYRAYVKAHGLPCQSCGGMGQSRGRGRYDPPEPCGWCETTGLVTRWLRGEYLNYMRSLKRAKRTA